jgi:AcrR family transcriptional regulator
MEENMNRRERKKIHSKNAIMEAAVKLFSQKGFQESSIADIMNEADLGIGTFYNYFESKEEVLRSLLGKIVGEIQQSFAALQAESRSSAEVLEETVMLTVNILSENRFVLPLFLSAADRSAMPKEASSHTGEAPAFKMIFDRIIREGQERGEFRRDIPAEVITEMFHSVFQAASFSSLPMSFKENVQCKLQLMMDGICTK